MTLGAMIDALKTARQDEMIRYDFGWLIPVKPDSYFGFYDHLAFGFAENHNPSTLARVGDLLAACHYANGAVFQGYKGGSYVMNRSTPLWAANRGRSTCTAITGLRALPWGYVIETAFQG
jgi:hypothetical protein